MKQAKAILIPLLGINGKHIFNSDKTTVITLSTYSELIFRPVNVSFQYVWFTFKLYLWIGWHDVYLGILRYINSISQFAYVILHKRLVMDVFMDAYACTIMIQSERKLILCWFLIRVTCFILSICAYVLLWMCERCAKFYWKYL